MSLFCCSMVPPQCHQHTYQIGLGWCCFPRVDDSLCLMSDALSLLAPWIHQDKGRLMLLIFCSIVDVVNHELRRLECNGLEISQQNPKNHKKIQRNVFLNKSNANSIHQLPSLGMQSIFFPWTSAKFGVQLTFSKFKCSEIRSSSTPSGHHLPLLQRMSGAILCYYRRPTTVPGTTMGDSSIYIHRQSTHGV